VTKHSYEWDEQCGFPKGTVLSRFKAGWPEEKLLSPMHSIVKRRVTDAVLAARKASGERLKNFLNENPEAKKQAVLKMSQAAARRPRSANGTFKKRVRAVVQEWERKRG
jgi:hypothetical protein